MALLVGHRTCDLQVAGSSPGWAPLRNGLGQALSSSSIIWYRQGSDLFGWKSNCRQPTIGFMTNVTCGLTAKKP